MLVVSVPSCPRLCGVCMSSKIALQWLNSDDVCKDVLLRRVHIVYTREPNGGRNTHGQKLTLWGDDFKLPPILDVWRLCLYQPPLPYAHVQLPQLQVVLRSHRSPRAHKVSRTG